MNERGFLVDRLTQAWVRATGRTVRLDEHPWLDGPVGGPTLIGEEWLPREADRLGGRVRFDVVGVSCPAQPIARLLPFIADRLQDAAVHRYLSAITRAVATDRPT